MSRLFAVLLGLSALVASASAGIALTGDAVFTSTRSITCLAIAPDGTLWVGTSGGVLRRSKDSEWRRFTQLDGLPSHEVRSIAVEQGAVVATFPRASATWRDGRWVPGEVPPAARADTMPQQTCAAVWRSEPSVATVDGLYIGYANNRRRFDLPPSTGTHLSALLPHGEELWAAMFDQGLWAFNGKTWRALNLGLPSQAREITALTADGQTLWLGTRREGVWQYDRRRWKQHLQPNEPYAHNCQALIYWRSGIYVSTLEDGLVAQTPSGWQHYAVPVLSSNAPGQMVAFGGSLYLRHGNGKVDRFDGKRWTRNVCSSLPRKEVRALAADGNRLYAAQWGGWSEFDGHTWKHHLSIAELQGVAITILSPERDRLWIGTQGRGLGEFDRATGRLRWHDERQGLPDDWVTGIARAGDTLCVATFLGGLSRWDGARWEVSAELRDQNLTAIAPDGAGGLFIATREGVWHQTRDSSLRRLVADVEGQALCLAPGGLWIGSRTELHFLAKP